MSILFNMKPPATYYHAIFYDMTIINKEGELSHTTVMVIVISDLCD